MNRVTKIFIGISLLISIGASAQHPTISGLTTETPDEFYLQVKQFGEFIDRFNYLSDFKGNRITEEFSKKISRPDYINLLMNQQDPRIKNEDYVQLCKNFIAYVTHSENPKTIHLFANNVVATAKVNITYAKQPGEAIFEFGTEVLPDKSAKWVIKKITTNFFTEILTHQTDEFLAPNSHETNFMNINKLESIPHPILLFSSEIANNTTLLFLTELAKGQIAIQSIDNVTYSVDIDHWQILVENFNRGGNNSGWLISDIVEN